MIEGYSNRRVEPALRRGGSYELKPKPASKRKPAKAKNEKAHDVRNPRDKR